MRKALYATLKKVVPVYHIGTAKMKTVKPYAIMKFGTPILSSLASFTTFTITVYADVDDTETLDDVAEKVVKALDHVRIDRVCDGSTFLPEFTGELDDFTDDELLAIGKPLTFRVPRFGKDFM